MEVDELEKMKMKLKEVIDRNKHNKNETPKDIQEEMMLEFKINKEERSEKTYRYSVIFLDKAKKSATTLVVGFNLPRIRNFMNRLGFTIEDFPTGRSMADFRIYDGDLYLRNVKSKSIRNDKLLYKFYILCFKNDSKSIEKYNTLKSDYDKFSSIVEEYFSVS